MPRKPKREPKEINCEDKFTEKKQLLKALQDHGPSIIHNSDLLKSYFPNKSLAEINFLISIYEKKGKELNQKESYIDSLPELKNISQWTSAISNSVPFPAKKDDMSQLLRDCFNRTEKMFSSNSNFNSTSDDEESTMDIGDERINYQIIHSYFKAILNGQFPASIENKEAAVVLSIMDSLSEMVESLGNYNEKDFLNSESWWKTSQAITNGVPRQSHDDVEASSSSSSPSTTNQSEQNGNNPSNDPNDLNNPEYYSSLPRIRRIRECFNPLGISSTILDENHDLMTAFLI